MKTMSYKKSKYLMDQKQVHKKVKKPLKNLRVDEATNHQLIQAHLEEASNLLANQKNKVN